MRLVRKILRKILAVLRRIFYRFISDAKVKGSPICAAPLLTQGLGTVIFEKDVHIGLANDTDFWTSYVFLNSRTSESQIAFGEGSWLGNHFVAISEGPGIFIGKNVLIGTHVEIYDSDFHAVHTESRLVSKPKKVAVKIGNRVWIGNNATILKGTEIGENCVVAAGAVVSGKFPANVILGGVPAQIIGEVHV